MDRRTRPLAVAAGFAGEHNGVRVRVAAQSQWRQEHRPEPGLSRISRRARDVRRCRFAPGAQRLRLLAACSTIPRWAPPPARFVSATGVPFAPDCRALEYALMNGIPRLAQSNFAHVMIARGRRRCSSARCCARSGAGGRCGIRRRQRPRNMWPGRGNTTPLPRMRCDIEHAAARQNASSSSRGEFPTRLPPPGCFPLLNQLTGGRAAIFKRCTRVASLGHEVPIRRERCHLARRSSSSKTFCGRCEHLWLAMLARPY